VGTTGVGSSNIFNGALGTATSAQITNIPIAGATLYVRLNYQLGASLDSIDYQYTEAPAPTPPVLTTPPPSSTLSGPGATFIWTHGSNITEYQFTLGTTGPGSSDVYNGSPTTTTSAAVTNIPTNGAVLYARLSYLAYGSWSPIDYQYTEAPAPIQPALATPTPGSTLSGSSATFTWNPGTGSTSFRLQVGTLGTGSSDIYNGTATTTTSVTLHNLPVNGAQLYVRLNYLMNSVWSSIDYMLTEASPVLPSLTTPAPGSTLTGSSAPFSWNPGNVATFFELQVGTAPDMHDVYNGGPTKTTSVSARNIPANGVTLYATLYYELNHDWHAIDYQYTESGTPTLPFMTSPAPHSTLTGSAATFSWDPGAGATRFELLVGTGPGLGDIYRGGPTTATSVQVSNVPTKGKKIFAELYYELSGKWHDILYTFTEAP
jgi:hypothetical protein